ncbi:MAG: hypothetical protein LLG97_10985 [Deltaproteobacteria bacterium]|nr:hypothetical protein [Deltaproteobacteria bacterium]
MAKLGKREMIILGALAVVVLYAAFDYLMPKKKAAGIDTTQKSAELQTFVSNLTASMGKDSSKDLGTLVFSRAEREWAQDPFLDNKSYRSWTQAKVIAAKEPVVAAAAPKVEFVYSGYLEVGKKKMAIVNGMEYSEGDGLDIKGYFLKSASPSNVVIENRGTGASINVPLLE